MYYRPTEQIKTLKVSEDKLPMSETIHFLLGLEQKKVLENHWCRIFWQQKLYNRRRK